MLSKRQLLFIVVAVASVIYVDLSNIYVPEGFERPILYKAIAGFAKLCGSLVSKINFQISKFNFYLKKA